jgi:hypothetical protein
MKLECRLAPARSLIEPARFGKLQGGSNAAGDCGRRSVEQLEAVCSRTIEPVGPQMDAPDSIGQTDR